MIGLIVEIETVQNQTHSLEVTWGVAYRWQQSHPNTTMERFVEERRIDEMLDLAWECAKTHGLTPAPIHQWVDTIKTVKFVAPKDSTTS